MSSPFRVVEWDAVPTDTAERLRHLAKTKGVSAAPNVGCGFVLGTLLGLGWTIAGIAKLATGLLTRDGVGFLALGVTALALTAFLYARKARRGLGSFVLNIEAYFIVSENGRLEIYSWAECSGFSFVNMLTNGIYNGTVMKCRFGDQTFTFMDHLKAAYREEPLLHSDDFKFVNDRIAHAKEAPFESLEGHDLFQ